MEQQSQEATSSELELSPESNAFDAHGRPMDLIGWPGYRNAEGKSGLGYLETQAEWAHMQGLFFRWMITGKFKTRNPIYLLLITVYGLMNASPILLLFAGVEGRNAILRNWSVFIPCILMGILLLVNVVLSLIKCDKGESITGE